MSTRQDLTVNQGETWSFTFTHKSGGSPVDLTGFVARMAVRATFSAGYLAYLSSGADAISGTIALGGALGTVTPSMTAAQTAALEPLMEQLPVGDDPTVFLRYDLELVSPAGAVTRALEGRFILRREVTT